MRKLANVTALITGYAKTESATASPASQVKNVNSLNAQSSATTMEYATKTADVLASLATKASLVVNYRCSTERLTNKVK